MALTEEDKLRQCIADRLRKLRHKKNISQVDLAHTINKCKQSLERVESGHTLPSLFYLLEIAKGLEMPLLDLLKEVIPPNI